MQYENAVPHTLRRRDFKFIMAEYHTGLLLIATLSWHHRRAALKALGCFGLAAARETVDARLDRVVRA